jgi:hypothetical protein
MCSFSWSIKYFFRKDGVYSGKKFQKYIKNWQPCFRQYTHQETKNVIDVLMLQLGREKQSFRIKKKTNPIEKSFVLMKL